MATTTSPSLALRRSKFEPQTKVALTERPYFFLLFSVAHLPLGVMMEKSILISTAHAVITALFGLYILFRRRTPENVFLFTAYVIGAEVSWRATNARIFWETGKYLTTAMLLVLLFFSKRSRVPVPALLFFMLLLVSVPATLLTTTLAEFKDYISFYLSGPFLIAVSLIVLSNFEIEDVDLIKQCRYMLAPLFLLSAAVLTNVAASEGIGFGNESNVLFSAGFGPNQVAAMLGLGAALAFIIAVTMNLGKLEQIFWFAAAFVMMIQAILTFSRGGVFMALIVIAVSTVLLFRVQRARAILIMVSVVAPIIATIYVLPRLNDFTGGFFETRFTDTETSGRNNLITGDLAAFEAHPLWGVGPGGSEVFHLVDFHKASRSHTEYTRVLAEHGVIGVAAFALLFLIVIINFFAKRTPLQYGILVPFAIWGFLFLAVNGFRIGAPAYLIGMSAIGTLVPPSLKRYQPRGEEQSV